MSFRAWHQLSPAGVAATVHRRVGELPPAQRRAVLAWLAPEAELARAVADGRAKTGPLAGLPYMLKDLFDVAGRSLLAGSDFLPEVRPPAARHGSMVNALEAAGAVLAGVTHLHEFAFGITGENPHHGDCEHPSFPGRTTGGSSSGSAAAVAAGIVPLAIGTDTGGSIRVPSAFCGLFGFRMTPHHPWIADGFPLAPSFDTAGWFTAEAEDMDMVLDALLDSPLARLGMLDDAGRSGGWMTLPGLDPEVARAFTSAAGRLARPLAEPQADALREAFAGAAEVYAVAGAVETWRVHSGWAERFAGRYDPAVKGRLDLARALPAAKIAAAHARIAVLKRAWTEYFADHDFLILPASPCEALTKGECNQASRNRILALTTPASLGGYPVLTMPVPLVSGLSTALQVVGRDLKSPVFRQALRKWPAVARPSHS
jgi:aspartyl-tRNA(Asn)/glutamyl-tRNA(Gln) amidotransferase subunit A